MKKLSKKQVNTSKGIMIVTVSVLGTITLAACSINYSELADGINDLGRGIDRAVNGTGEETTVSAETEPTADETEETEPSETEAPAPTATPTPTPKPTATPTPMPQRVDFSELTTDTISENVDVQIEEFAESYHADGEETELVSFTGNRIVVSIPDNTNIQTSLNLILDGFYQEAAGLYNRYSSEAEGQYALDPEMYLANKYDINVEYRYSFNGRLLSVIMEYGVVSGSEETRTDVYKKIEVATFDVLTGQYVTPAAVAKDIDALNAALASYLANAASTDDEEYTSDMVSSPILVAHSNDGGTHFAEIYGYINGNFTSVVADLSNYADYLNTYGKIVYKINH